MSKRRSKAAAGPPPKSTRKSPPNLEATSADPSACTSAISSNQTLSDDKAMPAGSSTEITHKFPSDVGAMVVDSPLVVESTGREFTNDALSWIVDFVQKILAISHFQDDGTNTAFDNIPYAILVAPLAVRFHHRCPESSIELPDELVKNMNVAKKRDPDFVNLFRQAIKENNEELWGRILTHDVFHIKIPDEPSSRPSHTAPPELQEKVVTRSWGAPFVGRAVETLLLHVIDERSKSGVYDPPFCPIVQSSGMGKSRLIDEFSKKNFLIPINLCKTGTRTFPPPDDSVHSLLTKYDSYQNVWSRLLHFLAALFEKTTKVITEDLKEADSRSMRITKFRDLMADGQTLDRAGEKRRKFYEEIVDEVENRMNTVRATESSVWHALQGLLSCLNGDSENENENGKLPTIFIAFDEAQSLVQPIEPNRDLERTYYIELCRALRALADTPSFVFFLSTTSKLSQPTKPVKVHPSARIIHLDLRTPLPFSDLGFDHLMHDRKIFGKFTTIECITSNECVVYMGRPLWGALYGSSEDVNHKTILEFAITKLLRGTDSGSGSLSLSTDQQFAVLSQRLALDIKNTANITRWSTKDYKRAEKAQLQIANHMRVCIDIPEDPAAVSSLAASEPILSEAASHIMMGKYNFDLPNALLNVLDSYSISPGDHGELLVAAFFMRARDVLVHRRPRSKNAPNQLCPIFSVNDLFYCLFQEEPFRVISSSLPSLCRAGFSPQMFEDVFLRTKVHFNHMIKKIDRGVLTRRGLFMMMARGAAAFCADGQYGFDMAFPFLYKTSDLRVEKVGCILVQVKHHAKSISPDANLFKMMDPFYCNLVDENDNLDVPIIRIVFSLGERKPSLVQQTYESPDDGAETLDEDGKPMFTSYDFWCSGFGPDLLRPVDENNSQAKWEKLLGGVDTSWEDVFTEAPIPDLRRSQFPGGGTDRGHFDTWLDPSHFQTVNDLV